MTAAPFCRPPECFGPAGPCAWDMPLGPCAVTGPGAWDVPWAVVLWVQAELVLRMRQNQESSGWSILECGSCPGGTGSVRWPQTHPPQVFVGTAIGQVGARVGEGSAQPCGEPGCTGRCLKHGGAGWPPPTEVRRQWPPHGLAAHAVASGPANVAAAYITSRSTILSHQVRRRPPQGAGMRYTGQSGMHVVMALLGGCVAQETSHQAAPAKVPGAVPRNAGPQMRAPASLPGVLCVPLWTSEPE